MAECLNTIELNSQEINNFAFDITLFKTFKYNLVEAALPDITMGTIKRYSPMSTIGSTIAGDDVDFGDLNCTFIVDEKLNNYRFLYRWILQLIESSKLNHMEPSNDEERALLNSNKTELYASATLFVLTNNSNVVNKINFHCLYPYALSDLRFSTLENYAITTCTATFKYHYFVFTD